MNRRRVAQAFGVVAFGAAILPAVADDGKNAPAEPCRAELVAKSTSIRPGAETTLGVRLVMAEHWHTYWKNPGESGIPTSVEWTLPKGFEASPMKWPTPRRIDGGGIVGYEGEVLFPVTLQVPADAKPGEVVLAAHVRWLVCRDVCEPGDVRVEIRLPVKDEAPVDDPARAAQFAAAAASLPRALPAGAATIDATKDRITLTVSAPDVAGLDVRAVEFFPADQLVLDDATPPAIETTKKSALRIGLTPAPRRDELVKRLRGVLTVATSKGASAFDVDAVAPESPGQPGEKSPK